MSYAFCLIVGGLLVLASVVIGFRLARLSPDASPQLSLPKTHQGYYPTQEEMDDAGDSQREA